MNYVYAILFGLAVVYFGTKFERNRLMEERNKVNALYERYRRERDGQMNPKINTNQNANVETLGLYDA